MTFIFQTGDICATEKRAVRKTSNDILHISYEPLCSENIEQDRIPIGSVEFCTKFLGLIGKDIPKHLSYPESLFPFLKRYISQELFENVAPGLFIKPVEQIKLFTGHVKGKTTESLPEGLEKVLVWVSSCVNFLAEWRYYILHSEIVGYSRYDDSDDEFAEPDITIINAAISDFDGAPIAYALDFGLLDTGDIALVEVNDAWALGLYKWGNMTDEKYVEMIIARWDEITR